MHHISGLTAYNTAIVIVKKQHSFIYLVFLKGEKSYFTVHIKALGSGDLFKNIEQLTTLHTILCMPKNPFLIPFSSHLFLLESSFCLKKQKTAGGRGGVMPKAGSKIWCVVLTLTKG